MMQPSALFRTFCEYFRLDDIQASGWRAALSEATWSEARSWAQEVQAFDLAPPHGPDKLAAVVPFFRTSRPRLGWSPCWKAAIPMCRSPLRPSRSCSAGFSADNAASGSWPFARSRRSDGIKLLLGVCPEFV